MIKQKPALSFNGYGLFILLLIIQIVSIVMVLSSIHTSVQTDTDPNFILLVTSILVAVLSLIGWAGFYKVEPNEGKIFQLFGNYAGTDHKAGLRWTIPMLFMKTPISLKVRNFESNKM